MTDCTVPACANAYPGSKCECEYCGGQGHGSNLLPVVLNMATWVRFRECFYCCKTVGHTELDVVEHLRQGCPTHLYEFDVPLDEATAEVWTW